MQMKPKPRGRGRPRNSPLPNAPAQVVYTPPVGRLKKEYSEKPKNSTTVMRKIIEAVTSLGGSATGAEITDWIMTNHPEICSGDHKVLSYRVNAVLSSKKHANVFVKSGTRDDSSKKIVWTVKDNANDMNIMDEESESEGDVDVMDLSDEGTTDSDQEAAEVYGVKK